MDAEIQKTVKSILSAGFDENRMRFKVVCVVPGVVDGNVMEGVPVDELLLKHHSYVAEGNKRLMVLDAIARDRNNMTSLDTSAHEEERRTCI